MKNFSRARKITLYLLAAVTIATSGMILAQAPETKFTKLKRAQARIVSAMKEIIHAERSDRPTTPAYH